MNFIKNNHNQRRKYSLCLNVKQLFLLSLLLITLASISACGDSATDPAEHEFEEFSVIAQENWIPVPADYEHLMTLVAMVTLDGESLNNSANRLLAYSGDSVRGLGQSFVYGDVILYNLLIYGHSNAEEIQFALWMDDEGKAVELENSLLFEMSGAYGSPDEPFELKIK